MDRRQFVVGGLATLAGLALPRSAGMIAYIARAQPAMRAAGSVLGRPGKHGVSWSAESLDATTREACWTLLDDIGASWARIGANWPRIDWAVTRAEGQAGNFAHRDWSEFDTVLDSALAHGKKPIVDVVQFAGWANGGNDGWFVPDNETALGYWGDFCAAVVARCESRWPGKVDLYEIWNEPECPRFWTNSVTRSGGPTHPELGADPFAYVRLLRRAYISMKAANPSAQIIGGVMSRTDVGFLRGGYVAAQAQFPDEHAAMNDYFDILGVHPYCDDRAPDDNDPAFIWNSGTLNRNFLGLVDLYGELLAHGDGAKGIVCTEFGWHTAPAYSGDQYVVSEAAQADYLVRAFDMAREWPWLKVLMTFGFMNAPFDEEPWSLIRSDFSRKPAYDAFKYASRRGTECG